MGDPVEDPKADLKEGGANTDADAGDGGGSGGGDGAGDKGRTFTQAELDAMISRRLARERKSWEDQRKSDEDKAKMSEAERLKTEKAELERATAEREKAATGRVIRSEARIALSAAGIKADRLDYALRLIDLSGVEVGEDGEPDLKAITAAAQQVVKDLPELVGQAPGSGDGGGSQKGGGDFSGGGGTTVTEAQVLEWLTDEAKRQEHWAEIQAFYAAKRQKR